MIDRLLKVDEVARHCSVSQKTVRRAIDRGELEAARLGDHGALRIRPEAIDDWLQRRSTRRRNAANVEPETLPLVVRPMVRRSRRTPSFLRLSDDMGAQ